MRQVLRDAPLTTCWINRSESGVDRCDLNVSVDIMTHYTNRQRLTLLLTLGWIAIIPVTGNMPLFLLLFIPKPWRLLYSQWSCYNGAMQNLICVVIHHFIALRFFRGGSFIFLFGAQYLKMMFIF